MDEDSTTVAEIRKSMPLEVIKEKEKTMQKNQGNDIYAIKKKHVILSLEVISYLQKYFSYAIKQHKNDPALKKTSIIQTIVPHCFGDHRK